MKTILTFAALLSFAGVALAQNTTSPNAEAMQQHHQQMQRIMQENDPAKRQPLWEAHMNTMRDSGGCPMMAAANGHHGMHHGMMSPQK